MKHFLTDTLPAVLLTVAVAFMSLAGCSRGLKYDPSLYSPEIQFIDSLRYNTGGPEYPEDVSVTPDSLLRSWIGFAERFSAGDYAGAYDFAQEDNNFSNIVIYLRNTTAQYVFFTSAWSDVIFNMKASEDFYREMDDLLNFNLAMVKTVIAMGGEDGYVPPHYTDLLRSMGMIYRLIGDRSVMESFCDEIYRGYMACGYGDIPSRLAVLYYRVQFLSDYDEADTALQEVRAFRDVVMEECPPEELASSLEVLVQLEEIAANPRQLKAETAQ